MKIALKMTLTASAIAVVAACGGGGGGGGGGSGSTTIGGVAIDGYLGGARVCVDFNLNFKCDAGEPFAITKDDGTYSIPWSGGDAAGLVVITETLPTTKDSDDLGRTFDELGKKSFTLAAPVPVGATTDIKITPLTTMITVDALPQDTNTTKRLDTTAVSNAATAIKVSLGMDAAKDLLKLDVTQDVAAKPIAQLLSHKLGGIQSESTNGLSVEKMKSAVVTAKNSTVGMLENGALPTAVTTALAKPPAERVAALNQNAQIKGTIDSASQVINLGTSNFDVKQALMNGVVISNFDSGYHPYVEGKVGNIGDWKRGQFLKVDFLKFGADGKPGSEVKRVLDNGWVRTTEWSTDHFLGTKGEWIKETPFGNPEESFAFSGNCAVNKKSSLMAASSQFCFAAKDLDGLIISKLNPSYCNPREDGATPEQTLCKAAKFKPGSKGYEVTVSVIGADEYYISIPNNASSSQNHFGNRGNGSFATNIAEFIVELNKKRTDTNVVHIWDDFVISIKSYDGKSSGVFNWFYKEGGDHLKQKPAGEGAFEIKSVNGVDVLVFKPSNEYHKMRPGDMVGQDFIFAAKDKRIWLGTVNYKDVKQQINLTGFNWFGNKEFLESILEGLKFNGSSLPAFPFDGK
jgi:hypothetical protein